MTYTKQSVESTVLQELLAQIRTESQLTQKQLSLRLKRPQSYVSKYESGERKLTLPEVRSIVLACNISFEGFVKLYEEELLMIEEK